MKRPCSPKDIALKSFFLGPQAENSAWVGALMSAALEEWFDWRRRSFPGDGRAISFSDQKTAEFEARKSRLTEEFQQLMKRFEGEIPKFSPRYIGHMVSEMSLPGLFGHFATLLHNPNNISAESSRVGVAIEGEAISALAAMLGFPAGVSGHFTSGGTLANFEGMLRARLAFERGLAASSDRASSPVILLPAHAHYSWKKGARLMGLPESAVWQIELDHRGMLCVRDLKTKLSQARELGRPVMLVVSVAGTTETGTIDPVEQIVELIWQLAPDAWHHVDAAFGGFFAAVGEPGLSAPTAKSMRALALADSVSLDPHKLGYVPYASGVFLCRERWAYELPMLDAPYIDYAPSDPGRMTLEGSRSAGGAVATYLTYKALGLGSDGLGRILTRTLDARHQIAQRLAEASKEVRILPAGDTNIICFCIAASVQSSSQVNRRTQELHARLAAGEFYVSKTELSRETYSALLERFAASWQGSFDTASLQVIRLCIMNPFVDSKEMNVDLSKALAQAVSSHLAQGRVR